MLRTRPRLRLPAVASALIGIVAVLALASTASAATVYWGAYIKGSTYGYGDAPFDSRSIDAFESHAGKRASIVHWGQPWYWGSRGGYQPFQRDMAERVRLRGSIPMITWTSEDLSRGGAVDQANFQLADIYNGAHDAYLRQWARDAKAWGKPLMIRFNHEMNGTWYAWSEARNGNSSGQFARMWRHVVDIFRQEGATNVTWVWAPNRVWSGALPLAGLYPGDGYVDWTGISGYNWGTNPAKPNNVWQNPTAVLKETYDALGVLAPSKPVMIAETASSEYGGSKAAWIKDLLQTQIPNWPRVKALVWFNWNCPATYGNMDWVIETSASAQSAFAAGIASSVYATNSFGGLSSGTKVAPLGTVPAPSTATSTTTSTVRNGSFETTGTSPWHAPWTVRNDLGASLAQDTTTAAAGSRSFRATLSRASSTEPWQVQLRQSGQALTAGRTSTVSFWAKASAARPVTVALQRAGSPYNVYLQRDVSLTTAWTKYSFAVTPGTSDASVMVVLNLAKATGTVWIDDVRLVS